MTDMTAQMTTQSYRSDLLRNVLRANAAFSVISGGLMMLASAQVAAFLGIDNAPLFGSLSGSTLMLILGFGILLFGLDVLYVATRPALNRTFASLILAADIAWVVISAIILLTQALPFSTQGNWTVLIVADIVALFAIGEYIGLRRLR